MTLKSLLIYGLFNDTFNTSYCISSNVKVFGELGRSVKKQYWLKLKYYRGTCLGRLRKIKITLFTIAGLRVTTVTRDLPSLTKKKVQSN
jgi:hypothetical protein